MESIDKSVPVAEDVRPMTPDEVAWVRAQRITEEDPESCRVPGVAEGTCAYAGPDGADGCGVRCLYRPLLNDGSDAGDACGCPCHQVVQPGLVPCPRCEQEGARP